MLMGAPRAHSKDLKITIPERSHPTPVQRLNRGGVDAIRKHDYKKAESLFYKAYLLDPDDPFTLNNLGYTSEIQGQVDRAERFYALAGKQATDATIDVASSPKLKGQPMNAALAMPGGPLQLNYDNVEAIRLLSQGNAPEADLLLQDALKNDPKNVFTLNNLGVAKEMEGESAEALRYYDAAAASSSSAAVVVTLAHAWRGKAATAIASQNASVLRHRLESRDNPEAHAAELNLRGVSAINRNDAREADQDFRKAYAMDPNNAFALNNIGYVSELEGDQETAQFFYDSARKAPGANDKVILATRSSAEGLKLSQVAENSNAKVENKVAEERVARRQEGGPILLRRRDNSLVEERSSPPTNPPAKTLQPVDNPPMPQQNPPSQ